VKYDYVKLYPERDGTFTLKGFGTYPRHSVNFGMTRIVFLGCYDSEADAQADYPELGDDGSQYGSKWLEPNQSLPLNPPQDFDPTYCGERWDDDY